MRNRLYRADCKAVINNLIRERVRVDLIYLDPPFNSNRTYSMIFQQDGVTAQQKAYHDMWDFTDQTRQLVMEFRSEIEKWDLAQSFKQFILVWVNILEQSSSDEKKLLNYLMHGLSLCFRSPHMLIGVLRSRRGFRTVPGDLREFGLGGVGFERCQAGWRDGIRPRLRQIGGRAAAGARPAAIGRVVRRCRGSRRVPGACRCRAGCRKPLRCGGDGSSGTRTRRGSGADGRGAGHGRFRAPGALQVREHTMDPRQHERGGRCANDPGLAVVVGQAAIPSPAIGHHPRARRRGPGNEGTKAARGEIPDQRQPDAAWLALGDSSTAPAMRILPCGLRPCPPVAGSLAVRNGRGASSISIGSSSKLRSGSTMARRRLCSPSRALL